VPLDRVGGKLNPLGRGHKAHFLNDSLERIPGLLDRSHIADRESYGRSHSRLRADERKLVPQHRADVVRELCVYAGLQAGIQVQLRALASSAVHLAEHDAGRASRVSDDAGLGDPREDVGGAAHDVSPPNDTLDLLLVVDSVLERDDCGLLPKERAEAACSCFVVERLDAEQHVVGRPDVGGVVGRGKCDVEVTPRAPDPEPMVAKRLEMSSTCDELNVDAGEREAPAEVATNPAGSINRQLHPGISRRSRCEYDLGRRSAS
jgi:hypothetical protein